MGNIILLSGEPRIGKTTALKKIIHSIGKENCIGFYTEEIRGKFDRSGFQCVSLDGTRKKIADVNLDTNVRMGRYGIDIEGFENFAIPILNNSYTSNKITIIDEIGPIQFLSTKFKQEISNILTSSTCVIGTIFYNNHPDIDKIKRIPGVKIYYMAIENRTTILETVLQEIQQVVHSSSLSKEASI
ncbi:nucleoside-triphosphatase [Clostridium cellulovorans]|uniref:NTPase n=1 Tax=Clostridium cellulovorans (strain ATCC 35296 / DSM 3052 / OCM 3 / 743B) TaxID=573061 RepID=D9SN47_CLOC7|nr:nucleoside-triphosphatase [Clostridium cellulovorans]ADL51913.1 protein of unknown function DUF265 [Clostridium cellulovorans 743B]